MGDQCGNDPLNVDVITINTSSKKTQESVTRRNERERRRIQQVNGAYDELRRLVPKGDYLRKLSKVETLRSAIEYIKALEEVIERQKILASDIT